MKHETLAEVLALIDDYGTAVNRSRERAILGEVTAILSRHVEQPAETEEQAAERELGAFMLKHPAWTVSSAIMTTEGGYCRLVWPHLSQSIGRGKTVADAIRAAVRNACDQCEAGTLRLAKETDNAD